MRRLTGALAAVGLAVFVLGCLAVVAPEALEGLSVGSVTDDLGGPWVFVAVFGAVALVALLLVQTDRAVGGLDEATPPDPEGVYEVPHPGHRFDEFVTGGPSLRERLVGDRHEQASARVREVALATLTRSGMSRDEARTALDAGTWTDDPVAAAFLATDESPGLGTRVRAALRGESAFAHGARRAADAIAERRRER